MKTNLIARVKVAPFVKTLTRVGNAASGDVSYTGVGFKPSALIMISKIEAKGGSIGFDNVTYQSMLWVGTDDGLGYNASGLAKVASVTGNGQTCFCKSLDADGFTLTWTLLGGGGGAGAQTYYVLCLR